ncbi:hypothetical protein NDU88_006667 [Pleurodeles waltl]|uniref:Uncharacterized protein n=1 Tax=Pleurodeles waltl TaxID=8319 RepID=A0AAV7MZW4_PLEWA|nr:hypothetical protein NDU88_006667 [Pleurodeles waltl]
MLLGSRVVIGCCWAGSPTWPCIKNVNVDCLSRLPLRDTKEDAGNDNDEQRLVASLDEECRGSITEED